MLIPNFCSVQPHCSLDDWGFLEPKALGNSYSPSFDVGQLPNELHGGFLSHGAYLKSSKSWMTLT